MRALLCAIGLLVWSGSSALCQQTWFVSGPALRERCNTPIGSSDSTLSPALIDCLAYIKGVVDMISTFQDKKMIPQALCVPPGTGVEKLWIVVHSFLKDHPSENPPDASILVLVALATAWPCAGAR